MVGNCKKFVTRNIVFDPVRNFIGKITDIKLKTSEDRPRILFVPELAMVLFPGGKRADIILFGEHFSAHVNRRGK
jgi:hypothetical protein